MERQEAIEYLARQVYDGLDLDSIESIIIEQQEKYFATLSSDELEEQLQIFDDELTIDNKEDFKPCGNAGRKLVVSVIRDNAIDRLAVFNEDQVEQAEQFFLSECAAVLSNWDEYTNEDMTAILDNGIESFGCGSVCITWTED